MLQTTKEFKSSRKIDIASIVTAAMVVLTAMTGFFNQEILSLGIVACCGVLLLCDKLYLGFPFVIFYNSFYGLVLGTSVLRLYTLLVLAQFFLHFTRKSVLRISYLPVLLVYTLFLILVMIPHNIREGLFLFLDIACCMSIVATLTNDVEKLKSFFKVYTFVCFCSYITGTFFENSVGNEMYYMRFQATFEDPNYMGFFFTLAIFATVTLKLFPKIWRWAIVVVLYVMMLSSLSMTAILVNTILWLVYLALTRKINVKTFIVIVLVIALLLSAYAYGQSDPDAPIFGDLATRLDEKIEDLQGGDYDELTTGRLHLSERNLKFYWNLPVFNLLFGGYSVNCRYIHPDLSAVSHNEYVDLLLNVGLFGALVMIGFFAYAYWQHIKRYLADRQDADLCVVMLKTIWLLYAFTLTMFLDFRFMFVFLM